MCLFNKTNTLRLDGSFLLNSLMIRRKGYCMNKTLFWVSPDNGNSVMSKIPSSPSCLKSRQLSGSGVNGCRIWPSVLLDLLFPTALNKTKRSPVKSIFRFLLVKITVEIINKQVLCSLCLSDRDSKHVHIAQRSTLQRHSSSPGFFGCIHTLQCACYVEMLVDMPKTLFLHSWNLHPSSPIPTAMSNPGATVLIQLPSLCFWGKYEWCDLKDLCEVNRCLQSPSTLDFWSPLGPPGDASV